MTSSQKSCNTIKVTIYHLLSKATDEYNRRGRGSPDPSLGLLELESSHLPHDSGADDFDMDLLLDSDDNSDCQPPVDKSTIGEEEMLAESVPFT